MSIIQPKLATSTSIWHLLLIIALANQVISKWDEDDRCGRTFHSVPKFSATNKISGRLQLAAGAIPAYVRIGASGINKTSRCGGALINDQHILTTAECAIQSQFDKKVFSSMGKYLGHVDQICTPGNKNQYKFADFGIIKLSKKVEMNDEVQSICLQVHITHHSKRSYFVVSKDLESGNQTASWATPYRGELCSDNPTLRCFVGRKALREGQLCKEDQGAMIIDRPMLLQLKGLVLGPHSSNGACSREFEALMIDHNNLDHIRGLLDGCE